MGRRRFIGIGLAVFGLLTGPGVRHGVGAGCASRATADRSAATGLRRAQAAVRRPTRRARGEAGRGRGRTGRARRGGCRSAARGAGAARRGRRGRAERHAAGVRQRPSPPRRCSTRTWRSSATSSAPRDEPVSQSVGPADPRALQMHESEASFQAVVDPYARADFFISFGEEGVDLEEGFITFTSLPGGLLTKVGKMRAAFGKVNSLHNHVLPWADRPLVIENLVGGEDGINDAGISVARLIPNPWLFLEATGQVFRGDSGPDEQSAVPDEPAQRPELRRSRARLPGHHRQQQHRLRRLVLARPQRARASAIGADLGRSRPSCSASTRPIAGSRCSDRSTTRSSAAPSGSGAAAISRTACSAASGIYVSGDYQLARRWFAGVRFDRSDHADNASLLDTGGSLILTYWPSEFSQVRGAVPAHRTTRRDQRANEFLFQFQFSIGAHGAHPF